VAANWRYAFAPDLGRRPRARGLLHIVVGTDAPSTRATRAAGPRALFGLARTGSSYSNAAATSPSPSRRRPPCGRGTATPAGPAHRPAARGALAALPGRARGHRGGRVQRPAQATTVTATAGPWRPFRRSRAGDPGEASRRALRRARLPRDNRGRSFPDHARPRHDVPQLRQRDPAGAGFCPGCGQRVPGGTAVTNGSASEAKTPGPACLPKRPSWHRGRRGRSASQRRRTSPRRPMGLGERELRGHARARSAFDRVTASSPLGAGGMGVVYQAWTTSWASPSR